MHDSQKMDHCITNPCIAVFGALQEILAAYLHDVQIASKVHLLTTTKTLHNALILQQLLKVG